MAKVVIADYPALSVDYSWGGLSTMVVITIAMLKPELKSLLANCFLSSPPAFQPLMQILIHCPVNLLIANPIFFFTLSTTFFLRLSGLPAHSAWCSSQSWYYMFNIISSVSSSFNMFYNNSKVKKNLFKIGNQLLFPPCVGTAGHNTEPGCILHNVHTSSSSSSQLVLCL